MNFTWLKSYMPRSLFGRSLMILLFPVVILQLVIGLVFIQRHFAQVTKQMTHAVALELDYAADLIESIDDQNKARLTLFTFARPFDMRLDLRKDESVSPYVQRYFYDVSGKSIINTLLRGLDRPVSIDLTSDPERVLLRMQTTKGVITASIPRARVSATNPHQLLVLMVLVSILLTVISILFLRNQIRPIRELAKASEAFGKGQSVDYAPRGANEVRSAGYSFLAMRARIERQIEQRTNMLSGVSHDMRTPLTRMKLSLAMLDDSEEVRHISKDVADMEKMLDGFLDFARGAALEEAKIVNADSFFSDIASDNTRNGENLAYAFVSESRQQDIVLRPDSVTRAINNLLGNAFRHAKNVRMEVRLDDKALSIVIEDDGPGIAESDRDEAMKPFVRLDPARNHDANDGVGLGLAIAADIARNHGGSLTLGASETLGGLKAVLTIPR